MSSACRYSGDTLSMDAGYRHTPSASANARSGVPSRATTKVLVSRSFGSGGGNARSSTSSRLSTATVPQRSVGNSHCRARSARRLKGNDVIG